MFKGYKFLLIPDENTNSQELKQALTIIENLPGVQEESIYIFSLFKLNPNFDFFNRVLFSIENLFLSEKRQFINKKYFKEKLYNTVSDYSLFKFDDDKLIIVIFNRESLGFFKDISTNTLDFSELNLCVLIGSLEVLFEIDFSSVTLFNNSFKISEVKFFSRNYITLNFEMSMKVLANEISEALMKQLNSGKNSFITVLSGQKSMNLYIYRLRIVKYYIKRLIRKYWNLILNYCTKKNWNSYVYNVQSNKLVKLDAPFRNKHDFNADPFLYSFKGQIFCFVEIFDYLDKKGKIGIFRIQDDSALFLGIALEEEFHISYPFIFSDGEDIYMCPETSEISEIRIYKALNFPFDWIYENTLIRGIKAVDTNIFKSNGMWVILTNPVYPNTGDHSIFLTAYTNGALSEGGWNEIRSGYIYKDASRARSGGFWQDGESLFRVNQIQGFNSYGENIALNKILECSSESYVESEITLPDFIRNLRADKIHHLHKIGNLFAFDSIGLRKV